MSLTISVEGKQGRQYVLMVDKISYAVEIASLHSNYACNIVMSDRPNVVECIESARDVQAKIEEAKTQHRAELTCIVEALATLYRDNVDTATSDGRAIVSAIDYDALLSTIAQVHDVAAAALGRPGRLADEALKLDHDMARLEQALDVDFEQLRVLHRVVRAMHDGECLQCSANGKGRLRSPSELQAPAFPNYTHLAFLCDVCGLQITKDQVNVSLRHWQRIAGNNMAVWNQFWGPQESA